MIFGLKQNKYVINISSVYNRFKFGWTTIKRLRLRLRFPKNFSLIQVIHKRYGNTVVKLVGTFEKLDFKHQKAALDLQFLKTCQEFKVTPKFLQFRVANDSLRQPQTYQTCKKWLLLEEIGIKKKNLKTLVRELSAVKEELLRSTSFLDFNHVFNLIVSSNGKSILKCRHVQQKKLRNLIPGYKTETSPGSNDPEKVIFNFSSLCKGLRFALPPKKIMQIFYYNLDFCIVILWNLIYHLRSVICFKINLRVFAFLL